MERDYSVFEIESNTPDEVTVDEETAEDKPDGAEADADNSEVADQEKDEPKADEPKPRSKSRAQKRIEALAKEKRELQRELEELRKSSKAPQVQELDPDDFDDYDDYLEAVEKQTSKKPEAKEEVNVDQLFEIRDEMEAKFDEARDKYDDFDDKVRGMPVLTVEMLQAITESDSAGDVAYYLADKPELAKKMADMSPYKMAIEIGKIELKLNEPKEETRAPAKKTTKAPEPIEPSSGANGQPKSLSDAEDFSEYEAMRNAQTSRKTGWV